jgi:hypothetical protein
MVYGERILPIPSNREYDVNQIRFLLRELSEIVGRVISVPAWNFLD